MGIALPSFLLNIQGAASGAVLLGLVGLGILLPLMIAVVYLSRSSKYTGNYVMHQTLMNYYHFMKQSLALRCDFSPSTAETLIVLPVSVDFFVIVLFKEHVRNGDTPAWMLCWSCK